MAAPAGGGVLTSAQVLLALALRIRRGTATERFVRVIVRQIEELHQRVADFGAPLTKL